ncbi:hypothetical protein J6590_032832 [Homalodisca vitripennis]|nr:hypothetical protein J6590_032832 [Homalodisca vitripennis]
MFVWFCDPNKQFRETRGGGRERERGEGGEGEERERERETNVFNAPKTFVLRPSGAEQKALQKTELPCRRPSCLAEDRAALQKTELTECSTQPVCSES